MADGISGSTPDFSSRDYAPATRLLYFSGNQHRVSRQQTNTNQNVISCGSAEIATSSRSTRHAMTLHPSRSVANSNVSSANLAVYPRYCHTLSPTLGKWCPLRASDVVRLGEIDGFQGMSVLPICLPCLILRFAVFVLFRGCGAKGD